MLESNHNEPRVLTAQKIDDGSSLLPMLVAGLVLISLGYAAIMLFV
jgi:hypothetical protein